AASLVHPLGARQVPGRAPQESDNVSRRREPERRGYGGLGRLLRDPPAAPTTPDLGRGEGRRGAAAGGLPPLHLVSPAGPRRPAPGPAPRRPGPRLPPEAPPRLQGRDGGGPRRPDDAGGAAAERRRHRESRALYRRPHPPRRSGEVDGLSGVPASEPPEPVDRARVAHPW